MGGIDLTHLVRPGGGPSAVKAVGRNGAGAAAGDVRRGFGSFLANCYAKVFALKAETVAMLNLDQHMDIRLLHRQGHSIRAIARLSGHSRNTVRKVLKAKAAPVFRAPARTSKLDPYKDYLRSRVAACNLSAVRLVQEIRQMGYSGGDTIVKEFLRKIRPRPSGKLTVRFETPPGEQAQCDWAYCGRYRDAAGKLHSVYAFLIVLSFSRLLFATFTTRMHLKTLVRCHQAAFQFFGGWPQVILYDNMKQVRLDPRTWNPQFVDFADHYGFTPKTHRPYRPRTKGKIERMVHYLKDGFLNGRSFADFDDLNAQGRAWLEQQANCRVHQTTQAKPRDLFAQEKATLTALSAIRPYQWIDREARVVNAEAMVLYEKSHYSVPPVAVGQKILVEAAGQQIRIRLGDTIIAEHPRAERAGDRLELPEHKRQRWETVLAEAAQNRRVGPSWTIGSAPTVQARDLSIYEGLAQ